MPHSSIQAVHIAIAGAVQGVGFRPFIYHLSKDMGLKGYVRNSSSGVDICAEGFPDDITQYLYRLQKEAPVDALLQRIESSPADVRGYRDFVIIESEIKTQPDTIAIPDLATCPQCQAEIFDPRNRRYRYPFTNCTHCGPRYSIVEKLPYDRVRTSMKKFTLCPECLREFYDPNDRRFHAQPNACQECGPILQLWSARGVVLEKNDSALNFAVEIIRSGKILALKGLGGFQLIVDASNEEAVKTLRLRKLRAEKPFALLYPSIKSVHRHCYISKREEALLLSRASPIVLLTRRDPSDCLPGLASSVAPDSPTLGVMLAYTPLHHLLMEHGETPVVATSGNLSDEPICVDEHEAVKRLGGIADYFLVHDRLIVRPMDDSVTRVIKDKTCILRRARGYAPMPIPVVDQKSCVMGLGAHFKNAVALKVKENIFLSQHIGDLQTSGSLDVFHATVKDLKNIYAPADLNYTCDSHPQYFSSRFAKTMAEDVMEIQHHHSHIAAGMAEHQLTGEVLGMAWDGTGLGDDGTIWGGEFLICTSAQYSRIGHIRTFRLPGGDASSREPRKTALGIIFELTSGCWEEYSDLPCFCGFSSGDIKILQTILTNETHSPRTSSMGRLFDAVSSLSGICQRSSYEGQGAMMLENALTHESGHESYWSDIREMKTEKGTRFIFDWGQMIRDIICDVRKDVRPGRISLRFHNALVDLGVGMAKRSQKKDVVLSGGCFQNKYLLEHLYDRLREQGFHVYFPQQVPINDGGIAVGQVMVASACKRDQIKKPSSLCS